MDIDKLVRKNIRSLKPYSSARSQYLTGTLMDANENNLGSVIENYNHLSLNRYPDPNQTELRSKLSLLIDIPVENLFFGVGSDEIIDLLVRIFCEPGIDKIIIPEPTYGMYKVVCDINGVVAVITTLDEDFQPDLSTLSEIFSPQSKIIFLCSPNNPTGNVLNRELVLELCQRFNGVVIADEAYIDFDSSQSLIQYVKKYDNLVVLRTFSKAWGLAGARCGYCAANQKIISYLFNVKAPYNMNKLTSDVILRALEQYEIKDKFVEVITEERKRVSRELSMIRDINKVFPSSSNFVLFKCNDANNVYKHLAERGIIIRNRSNQINLDNCLRVSIGTKEENDIFLNTLREIYEQNIG